MQRRQLSQSLAVLAAASALTPAAVLAQSDKPLRILLGFPPGGSIDVLARTIGDKLKDELKRPVVVENKPGASGRLAAETLKAAAPDGNTVMVCPIVVTVLAPLTFSKLSYNPAADFTPVAHLASINFALTVPNESPAKDVKELVAYFKANPQKASFGTPGAGSLPHFFGVGLGDATGVPVVHVPFQGGAQLQVALLGNQVASGFDVEMETLQSHRAGKLRVLATTGPQRSKILPNVPTMAEAGFPGIQGTSWFAMYAPAKLPQADLDSLNKAVNKVLGMPDVAEKLLGLGLATGGGSPANLAQLMDAETKRWAPVIKASGFRAD